MGISVVASKEKAEDLLAKVVETVLRVQTCTRCGICRKAAKEKAITVGETFSVD